MLDGASVFESLQTSTEVQKIRRSLTRVLLACISTGEKDVGVNGGNEIIFQLICIFLFCMIIIIVTQYDAVRIILVV